MTVKLLKEPKHLMHIRKLILKNVIDTDLNSTMIIGKIYRIKELLSLEQVLMIFL